MSRTALIASLIGFVALAAAAWLAIRPAQREAGGARWLEFDPSRVERVEIDDPGQAFAQRLTRDAVDDWLLTLAPREGEGDATVWPLIPSRVRTALRALAEAAFTPADAAAPTTDDSPVRVAITLASGAAMELAIASSVVGGKRLARVNGRTGLIDDAIHRALTAPGPREWRTRAAMPGVSADTSSLAIVRGEERVEMKRMRGVWRITHPVQAPADAVAVNAVIDALHELRVESFEDEPAPADVAAARLEEPVAVVVAGREARERGASGEVRNRLVERRLILGAPADLQGRTRFARAGEASPLLIIADGGAVEALSAEVERYLRRSAVLTRPENVGMATIETAEGVRGFRRDASGWSALSADGGSAPADGEAAQALLSFLADRIAREVSLTPPPGYAPAGVVTLYDFADGPLVTVEFGESGAGALVLRTDAVHRTYAGPAPELLATQEPSLR